MPANRTFEQTQLTKDILNAIATALEHMAECHLKTKLEKLFDKIRDEKMDIRLTPREY